MIKITINSAIACALFLCSGTMAMAGSPYNLTIPALGSQPKPHVAQPALQPKPVISRSVGHTKAKKKPMPRPFGPPPSYGRSHPRPTSSSQLNHLHPAQPALQPKPVISRSVGHTKAKKKPTPRPFGPPPSYGRSHPRPTSSSQLNHLHPAQPALQPKPVIGRSVGHAKAKKKSVQKKTGRAYSPMRQGALRPTEPKSRIPGVPVHRPAPAISIKQHLPVGTSGLGKRYGAGSHNSVPASRVRSGKTGGGGFAPPHRGGFAPARPLGSNGTTSGGSASSPSHSRGGFAPPGLAGQVHVGNALSPQKLARISRATALWERYKHAMEEKRRRDEAAAQAAREQRRRLSEQSVSRGSDCNDSDPEMHPGLLEICDHKDNNCDGRVDEGATIPKFLDADGDGHGDPAHGMQVCPSDITAGIEGGRFMSDLNNDCNDADPDHWHDCPAAESSR